MTSFILLVLILLSSTFIYKKRFTSGAKVGGLYLVQIYYLFMTPIGALLMLDIGSDIFSREVVGNLPIPANFLFNAFNFSVMMTVVGMGIHSMSTSVYQSFKKKDKLEKEAFQTNELFHGPWSHNMTYLGSIFSVMLLGLLELNHPYFGRVINFNLLLFGGILLGIMGVITMLRGTHIGFAIVGSFLASVILGFSFRSMAINTVSYPMATIALSCLVTVFVLLSGASIVFAISENLSKRVVKRAFPKGHPFHQGIELKVLTRKIEKDFTR